MSSASHFTLVRRVPVALPEIFEIPGVSQSGGMWRVPNDLLLHWGEYTPTPYAARLIKDDPGLWQKLYPHQQDDVRFLGGRRRGIIAHPCSGAKTLTGLAAGLEMATKHRRVLVSGPALSRGVWLTECKKWLSDDRATMHAVRGRYGTDAMDVPAHAPGDPRVQFVFVNHEVLPSWAQYLRHERWDAVLMDEFHDWRGRNSGRVVDGLRRVLMSNPTAARVGLTATPVWSRVDGLWTLLDLITSGAFGTQSSFIKRYSGGFYDDVNRRLIKGALTNSDELQGRLRYWIRSVAPTNLPAVTRQLIPIEHAGARKRLAAAAQRCVKNGQFNESDVRRALSDAACRETGHKLDTLWQYVRCREHQRLMVATQTRDAVAKVVAAAQAQGITAVGFTGDDALDKRLAIIAHAATLPPPVLVVCTMPSVRQSVDASVLDGGVAIELPFTAEEVIQWEGRLRRSSRSSGSPVDFAYLALEDTFDQRCIELIVQKLDERSKVVGATESDVDLGETFSHKGEKVVDDVLRGMLDKLGL